MRASRQALATVWFLAVCAGAAAGAPVHHDATVSFDLPTHTIRVADRVRLIGRAAPDPGGGYPFLLHRGLAPSTGTPGWRLEEAPGAEGASPAGSAPDPEVAQAPLRRWRLLPGEGAPETVEVRYAGAINDPIEEGEDYQRGFSETAGTIEERGVFLSGASGWLPDLGDDLITFDLTVEPPAPGWDVVSQGERTSPTPAPPDGRSAVRWHNPYPTDEAFLVAGPWTVYRRKAGEVTLLAFLREPDEGLAARYLDGARGYLEMYEGMLTPYPFPSFALVENFWDTGYGMPGFTLLGPRIIRFPFILTTSYPHEILHNWWGNSVYVRHGAGNWSEGLTAYMADHLTAEQRGEGAAYRRTALQKYTDFVRKGRDLPLEAFRSRHSAATEAVGYGKGLMVFHMLRRRVGDDAFLAALRRFHRDHLFSRAGFGDIASAFAEVAGGDWPAWMAAWTGRTGAPELRILSAEARRRPSGATGWLLSLRLGQVQPEDPFPLLVPVAVTLEGAKEPLLTYLRLDGRESEATVRLSARPLRLDVDPAFDLMRRLDPREVPAALSTLFGAEDPLFVLPAVAPEEEREAWKALATKWSRGGAPRTALDSDLEALPEGDVWVLGRENRLRAAVLDRAAEARSGSAGQGRGEALRADRSYVAVVRRSEAPRAAAGWVSAATPAAIPGLARKLPHYTRYSWLAFEGDAPDNVEKETGTASGSPLTRNLAEGPMPPLALPAREPLAEPPSRFDASGILGMVRELAAPEMEGRGLGSGGLARATTRVEARLAEIGLEPAGEAGFRQTWKWTGGVPERERELTNLLAVRPGDDRTLRREPVLVTAHLDHLGRGWPDVHAGDEGRIHPGADDNASGVAVLLAVADAMRRGPAPKRPVLFAVTTGEEAGLLGARHLLDSMRPGERPFACVNLDTVGRLGEGKLLVLDSDSAKEWPYVLQGVGYTTGVPIGFGAAGLGSSDQAACIERGIPGVQLTTGAHPDYHRPTDTADKVDAAGMGRVAEAVQETVAYLADREEPLTTGGTTPRGGAHGGSEGPRRAALGTVPDYSFAGPGVRVQEVLAGSPAEAAGVRPGDVLVSLDGKEVTDLRTYAGLLRAHAPGDRVELRVEREGRRVDLDAVLGER